jgi:hypothetical protein
MRRQNRVTPFGEIIATPERGTFMGNRGILHDEKGCIKRAWQVKRWLVCLLEFRGRKRTVMSPGHYTELFFLDEATALAAGHRPCFECQRARFNEFCEAWERAHGLSHRPTALEMDDRLHKERTGQKPWAKLKNLPNGVFVMWQEDAFLVYDRWLLAWSAGGYADRISRPANTRAIVLTPQSTVAVIRAGYAPVIHASATQLLA